jgi:hypothetical protein
MVAVLCNEGSLPPDVSPTGEADYDVYPLFLSLFFNAQAAMLSYNAALGQIKKVFEYIKHHRKPPHEISLDCRIDVLEASINGLPLPHCAGGPPNPALEVVSVSATVPEGSEKPVVSVIFNMPVDPVTAIALGNYFFDPGMLVFGASVDEGNPAKVDIVADVQPDIDYYLAVTGVLSINKQPVIIGKNGGKFKLS